MKDSILKGTGNSRFLKSAIPEGTTWAEALAMLQAGTFPIDFNGINTAGFQQVGTPLNKANLLKDATALTLGLTGDAVPNDMFNALAHAGDLHVWRKTVFSQQPVPAGYTLGSLESGTVYVAAGTSHGVNLYYSSAVSVLDDGSLVDITAGSSVVNVYYGNPLPDLLKGKFVQVSNTDKDYAGQPLNDGKIYYIPPTATFSNSIATLNQLQTVTGTPAIPAGTTVTYPVSTNRNAYQEGSDAKPAGYTLGDVVTGSFGIAKGNVDYNVSDSVSVADDGTLSLASPGSYMLGANFASQSQVINNFRGKFIQATSGLSYCDAPFSTGAIVFIPSDTTVPGTVYIDRYQPVTGYPAIPASTTIEYLGCLGEKVRMQVVSYVGTGTYGESNPCSITADFQMEVVFYLGYLSGTSFRDPNYNNDTQTEVLVNMPTVYKDGRGFTTRNGTRYGKISPDRKTLYWYGTGSYEQLNNSGDTYYFLAIA